MNVQVKTSVRIRLSSLHDMRQAVWLDFLARSFIAEGRSREADRQDGLTGVTSNPSIFEKAIGGSADYEGALKQFQARADHAMSWRSTSGWRSRISGAAADALRPVYDETQRRDGYVSLEVSPYLAKDTDANDRRGAAAVAAVGRDNLMIKVPATKAGLPAIRQLIGEGININITLLFSRQSMKRSSKPIWPGLRI